MKHSFVHKTINEQRALLEKSLVQKPDTASSADWTECVVTVGLMMFLLCASGIALGFAAERVTRGVIFVTQQSINAAVD